MTTYVKQGRNLFATKEGKTVCICLTKYGFIVSRGETDKGETLYENLRFDITSINNDIVDEVLWNCMEAATASVGMGISRFNNYSNLIREYIRERVSYYQNLMNMS